jgi:hypothetical protein
LIHIFFQFLPVTVLVFQCSLEVFIQANDHGALLLDQPPELAVMVRGALLLFPHGMQGSLRRTRSSYEAGHIRRHCLSRILRDFVLVTSVGPVRL